jgi:hypothetical protein
MEIKTEDVVDKIFQIVNNPKNKKLEIVNLPREKREKTNKKDVKNQLLKHFNIDNRFTEKKFRGRNDTFREFTYPKEDYNFSADLLVFPPYRGYKYILVVVDNWSKEIELEPLQNKKPKSILKAFQKIIDRPYLNKPIGSIRVDMGTEFRGEFKKQMYADDILLRVSMPARHKQNALAENAIKLISFILINYLNVKEIELQKNYRNWIELLPSLRKKLNEIRKIKDEDPFTKIYKSPVFKLNKYNIGDLMVHLIHKPVDALGKKQKGENYRVGDYIYSYHKPKQIIKILYYPNNVRYVMKGLKMVSFPENEILPYRKINTDVRNIK